MKRVLVSTDLSKNSTTGLMFAIQLASQYEVQLIFFHSMELLIPSAWDGVMAKVYMDKEIREATARLKKFVDQIYKATKIRPGKFDCVVKYGAPASKAILEYASEVNASYICMGTRGAGKFKRLFGTHTSAVLQKSPIPVFAIPKNYRTAAIKGILYASDFTLLKKELRAVKNFAKALDSSLSVVHYDHFLDPKVARKTFDLVTSRPGLSETKFHLEKFNWEETMGWNLNRTAKKLKADVVALFTDHGRQGFFRKSKSATATFDASKPILVYPK